MHALHFRKGCYVGQESLGKTVSMTTNAVRRRLCAITLTTTGDHIVAAGDSVIDENGKSQPLFHLNLYIEVTHPLLCFHQCRRNSWCRNYGDWS